MKLVIADQAYFERVGIRAMTDRPGSGHKVIGEADNGIRAVEVILGLQPDMVFLDLMLPVTDGFAVLEQIRREGYRGYVAILTSCGDFRMVQKALRLGADDYILKHELAQEEMPAYLDQVSEKIRLRQRDPDQTELFRQKEIRRIHGENFLKNVLWTGGISEEEFIRGCARYQIKIREKDIYIIHIYIRHWEKAMLRYKESNQQLLYAGIDRAVEPLFRIFPGHGSFYSDPFQYHILLTCSDASSVLKMEERLRPVIFEISDYLGQIMKLDVIIGVYHNTYPVSELHRGFQESLLLLEQHFFWPQKKVFWNGILHPYSIADTKELKASLDETVTEKTGLADTFWQYLVRQWDALMRRDEFLELAEAGIGKLEEFYGMSFGNALEEYEDMYALLSGIRLFETEAREHQAYASCSLLVKQALQMIHREFQQKITLEEAANRLGISAGYLSRIFSREMHQTFSDYVICKRIEYAKELVSATNDKFYEIAEQCGFGSAVHFNKMFKKRCRMTPNQYRERYGTKLVKKD